METGDSYKHVFGYACAVLARRRYSSNELRKKLLKRYRTQAEPIEQVISRLMELRYVNDLEYTNLFIDDQLRRKPQGIRLLRQKLAQKGIPEELIHESFRAKELDEVALATTAIQKKLKTLQGVSGQKKVEKIYRFLGSRGFSTGTITRVLKSDD